MAQTLTYTVIGEQTIHCIGCEQRIDLALRRVRGVKEVISELTDPAGPVDHRPGPSWPRTVRGQLEQIGYQVRPEDRSA